MRGQEGTITLLSKRKYVHESSKRQVLGKEEEEEEEDGSGKQVHNNSVPEGAFDDRKMLPNLFSMKEQLCESVKE